MSQVYDVDVLLTCETVFGVLEAARKYMVEVKHRAVYHALQLPCGIEML